MGRQPMIECPPLQFSPRLPEYCYVQGIYPGYLAALAALEALSTWVPRHLVLPNGASLSIRQVGRVQIPPQRVPPTGAIAMYTPAVNRDLISCLFPCQNAPGRVCAIQFASQQETPKHHN